MELTLETIRAAHARIAPYIVQTPLLRLPALDDDEFLNLQAVPLEELARDVLAGRIPDAKTQAAILRVYCMERGFEPK